MHIMNIRSSKVPVLMHLLWDLLMSAARFSLSSFSATHVPGTQNQIADAISCFCWQEFRCLAPPLPFIPHWVPKNFWISCLCQIGTVLTQPTLLLQSLAPFTQKSYSSAQNKFYEFCNQAGRLHKDGSPCPVDKWTLYRFPKFLADSLRASPIKANLSAVRSLHTEHVFRDPLLNWLRLQRVACSTKRVQGAASSKRLPVTDYIMLMIFKSLDLKFFDPCIFWATCMLVFCKLLSSLCPASKAFLLHAKWRLKTFSSIHWSLHLCLVWQKGFKGWPLSLYMWYCHTYWSGSLSFVCHSSTGDVFGCPGDRTCPLFHFQSGQPLSCPVLTSWLQEILAMVGFPGNFSSHSFRIGAATVATPQGIPDNLIQALGIWTKLS